MRVQLRASAICVGIVAASIDARLSEWVKTNDPFRPVLVHQRRAARLVRKFRSSPSTQWRSGRQINYGPRALAVYPGAAASRRGNGSRSPGIATSSARAVSRDQGPDREREQPDDVQRRIQEKPDHGDPGEDDERPFSGRPDEPATCGCPTRRWTVELDVIGNWVRHPTSNFTRLSLVNIAHPLTIFCREFHNERCRSCGHLSRPAGRARGTGTRAPVLCMDAFIPAPGSAGAPNKIAAPL